MCITNILVNCFLQWRNIKKQTTIHIILYMSWLVYIHKDHIYILLTKELYVSLKCLPRLIHKINSSGSIIISIELVIIFDLFHYFLYIYIIIFLFFKQTDHDKKVKSFNVSLKVKHLCQHVAELN